MTQSHLSDRMPGLIFLFLEHRSCIKWFSKSQWHFGAGNVCGYAKKKQKSTAMKNSASPDSCATSLH